MFWLVLTVVLGLVFWGGVAGVWLVDRRSAAVSGIAAVLWVTVSLFMSFHTLGTGEVALVYDFSGELTGSRPDPGVIKTWPWQEIKRENTLLQSETFVLAEDNSAVSKDQQSVFATIALNYEVNPEDVEGLYRDVGPGWKAKLVDSRVLQDFKEVTSQFTAAQITTRRPALRQRTRDRLAAEFKPYSVKVVDFFVRNLHYSAAYEAAIDRKNQQVQAALQAEAKVQQSTAEANQVIETARGSAESVKLAANADAEAIKVKAAATAYANRVVRQTLTPLVVKQNAIDKLNPKASVIYAPTGSSLLFGR